MAPKERCIRPHCENRAAEHLYIGSHKYPLCGECSEEVDRFLKFSAAMELQAKLQRLGREKWSKC